MHVCCVSSDSRKKCAHMYGVLCACLTFRFLFLCKNLSATDGWVCVIFIESFIYIVFVVGHIATSLPVCAIQALPIPSVGTLASYGVAVGCILLSLVLGLVSSKLKKHGRVFLFVMFLIVYASTLFPLAAWRLSGRA